MSVLRLGLSRSTVVHRPCGRLQGWVGNSPVVAALPPLHGCIFTGPCPGSGSLVQVVNVRPPPIGSPALLGLSTGRVCRASNGPDEAGELARDRGDRDGLGLASPDQCAVPPVEAVLRLPGDLANLTRRGRHLLLLVLAHPRRVLIAPGALPQHASRPPPSRPGDRAPLLPVARRIP